VQIYKKYGDKWIVDLLLNDLIDWHDWFATYRILKPAGLVCLGSNPVAGDNYWSPNSLNSAKLESGLDNSPMWYALHLNCSHRMQCLLRALPMRFWCRQPFRINMLCLRAAVRSSQGWFVIQQRDPSDATL
jgi:hypothetical protein